MNQIELDGKVAIVTGAAQGIGRAIAERLLNSGAQVWLWDRDEHVLAETTTQLGENARSLCVDVSAFQNVSAAVQTVADEAGQIDIMVNNAGISGVNTTVADYPVDEWQRVIEINLNGVFYGCKAVVPHMITRGYGRIVNIASRAALGKEFRTSYAGSKGALISATRVWALELGKYGITVNAIGPGPVETELFRHANPPDSERTLNLIDNIPVGRIGQPSDIAAAADYFLSDQAGYVTGQALFVCGGMSVGDAGN